MHNIVCNLQILCCLLMDPASVDDPNSEPCIFAVNALPQSSFIAWLNACVAMLDMEHLLALATKEEIKRIHTHYAHTIGRDPSCDQLNLNKATTRSEDGLFLTNVLGWLLLDLLDR